jgi:benzodiazapine receptor
MTQAAEPATSKRGLIGLAVAFGICLLAWAVGGVLTRPNLDWYATLAKPNFTPPNAVFPIVWGLLFMTMALSAWLVWRRNCSQGDKTTALAWFGIQLVLNVLWTVAFFALHSPGLGLAVVLLLLVSIVLTIVFFDKVSRPAALLLVPYLLWVGFATGLNFAVWVMNSDMMQAAA